MTTITVRITKVYGNETIYPVCERGLIFADMLRQKTLTRTDLDNIKKLGFVVELEQASL